jgi:hypothetical protein
MESNPLKQYFRQPAIWIRLPSQGQHYPPGALQVTENHEYPVLPMTTMDEITYRTPDALFNGAAVVSVIESCLPNIRDAWHVPSMDIDTILIAIRIATYGHSMEISTKCPKCETESDFDLDLRTVLEKIPAGDYSQIMQLGDLRIHFRPMDYQEINDNSLKQFEEQKMMQNIEQAGNVTDQEKLKLLSDALKKITVMTTEAVAKSIALIETPQARVDQREHISEWLKNCERNIFRRVQEHVVALKQYSEIKPLDIKCRNCSHGYQQNYTLDMSNFFGDAS